MTRMALTDPPLKRLFSRIDSSPQPRGEVVAQLFDTWLEKKGSRLAASLRDLENAISGRSLDECLIFVKEEGQRDYRLHSGEQPSTGYLGELRRGERLSQAPHRRNAARCRRVFDKVIETGEPLLVEFVAGRGAGEGNFAHEMLVLPLMAEDGSTNAVAVGVSSRPIAGHASKFRAPQWAHRKPWLFAFERDRPFAALIATNLGLDLSPLEEREFEDGEHKARPLVDVTNQEAFVVASLQGDDVQSVNDRLCRLLFFIGTLKTNDAARVTAVIPYLCYQRKDRQTKPHDPLTSRYVAQLLEAVGVDRVITMEAHNVAALQNSLRRPLLLLESHDAFALHLAGKLEGREVSVVAPDMGAAKRAEAFRVALEGYLARPVQKAFMEKQRSMGKVTGELFAGDVAGRTVVVYDDMISSGTTMARAAEACSKRGAESVHLVATHGLFSAKAADTLSRSFIDGIYVANTVISGTQIPRLESIDVSPIFARAIRACVARLSAP